MNIGLDDKNVKKITDGLSVFLADTYALYLKLQNYHWNITGEWFRDLHLMFEEQYNEINVAIDEIAERITQLGAVAPGSFKRFQELITVKEANSVPKSQDMIKDLIDTHEKVVRNARELIKTAEESNDVVTADLLTARMAFHEKTAWMLRSKL